MHVLYKNDKITSKISIRSKNSDAPIAVMTAIITATTKETAMTERITASEARKDFRGTLNRVVRNNERLVVTRHHDDEVAMIPIEDLRLLEKLERQMEDAIDAEAVGRMISENPRYAEESIPIEDLKEDLGL